MRIAIASLGKTEKSEISEVAGRSPYYLIFEDNKLVESISNPFTIGGGAGYGVAQMLKDKNIQKVIAGKFGDNMENSLIENDIQPIIKIGQIQKTLKEI